MNICRRTLQIISTQALKYQLCVPQSHTNGFILPFCAVVDGLAHHVREGSNMLQKIIRTLEAQSENIASSHQSLTSLNFDSAVSGLRPKLAGHRDELYGLERYFKLIRVRYYENDGSVSAFQSRQAEVYNGRV